MDGYQPRSKRGLKKFFCKLDRSPLLLTTWKNSVEKILSHFSIFSSSNTNERFPWLQEEEIHTLRSRNENSNTAKSTKKWLDVFNEQKLQRNEARRFEDIPPEELDAILWRFFADIRKKDGGEYEPESLAVMQSALDRHLRNAGKKHSILRDREFEKPPRHHCPIKRGI